MLPLSRSDESRSRQFSEFGLERDHPTGVADEPGGQQGVVPEVRPDVDHCHSWTAIPLEHLGEMRLVDARTEPGRHGGICGVAVQLDPADGASLRVHLAQLHRERRWRHLVLDSPKHPSDGGYFGQVTRPGSVDRPAQVFGKRRIDQVHQLFEAQATFRHGAAEQLYNARTPRGRRVRARLLPVFLPLVHGRPTVPRVARAVWVWPGTTATCGASDPCVLRVLQSDSLSQEGRRRGRPARSRVSQVATLRGVPSRGGESAFSTSLAT